MVVTNELGELTNSISHDPVCKNLQKESKLLTMGPIHLSTILAHNTTNITSQIVRLSLKYGGRGHTILFALSANFPRSEDLQQVVNTLIKFNDTEVVGDTHDALSTKGKRKLKGHTLGCLAGSFSSTSFETSSVSQTTYGFHITT